MGKNEQVAPSALPSDRQIWTVRINAPIETVWNTLVKTDAVLPFLFGAVYDTEAGLEAGKPFRMVSRNGKNVLAVGRVLEFTPPTRFSHSISFTQVEGEQPGRSTYELREIPGGTELNLIYEAVAGSKTAKMGKSGPFIVKNLKWLAESGRPAFSGALVMAMNPILGLFSSRSSRIKHWPLDDSIR
jgi:uncharacterized protein YndB with AHSA1/START domain